MVRFLEEWPRSNAGVLGGARSRAYAVTGRRLIPAFGVGLAMPCTLLAIGPLILFGIVLAIGSASVLYQTHRLLMPYPDCLAGALLYRDLQQDGLIGLRQWILPADNFLLTLHVGTQPWFAFFGTSVASLVALSYGIFLLGVFLTGWIVYRVTGHKGRAALSTFLLFAGPTNLMNANQTHPVGHNSTMVYVLLACLVVTAILTSGRGDLRKLLALGAIVAVSTFSDPWFDAVFTAPAAVVLASLAFRPGAHGPKAVWPAGLGLVSVLVGLMAGQILYTIAAWQGFVEDRSALVGPIDTLPVRLRALGRALPVLFNVDPREGLGLLEWAFLGCSLGLIILVVRHGSAVWGRAPSARRFILAFALMSLASVTVAFLGTSYAETGDLAPARYLLNVYYMVFLVGAVIFGDAPLRGWRRLVLIAWVGLFAVSGAWASWRSFQAHGFEHESFDDHRSILAGLSEAGLTRGLAPHFSGLIGANSLTYLGAEKITIRPVEVSGGYLRPSGVDVKRRWYDKDQSASFLIVHRSDVPTYEAAAIASFGPPSATVHRAHYVAWVWDIDIMRSLTPLPLEP